MNLFTIAAYVLAFVSLAYGIFVYALVSRKKKTNMIQESQTENGADLIIFRKAMSKAFFYSGVIELIGASITLLGGVWFWAGCGVFVVGWIVLMIMLRSAQKINPMIQR